MAQLGIIKNSLVVFILLLIIGCSGDKKTTGTPIAIKGKKPTPTFNADSAYLYIQHQVDFGPRVPNSLAHANCHQYLVKKLKSFGADVTTQEALIKRYDGLGLNMKNIIAIFNKDANKRILLCAHWDSRFTADNDTQDIEKPILGANDGGSGVGVLLEIARQLSLSPIQVGVDIIFF